MNKLAAGPVFAEPSGEVETGLPPEAGAAILEVPAAGIAQREAWPAKVVVRRMVLAVGKGYVAVAADSVEQVKVLRRGR